MSPARCTGSTHNQTSDFYVLAGYIRGLHGKHTTLHLPQLKKGAMQYVNYMSVKLRYCTLR